MASSNEASAGASRRSPRSERSSRHATPVAITGMACRFAGTATSPQKLWQMLTRAQSGWSRGDNSRFRLDSFYHPSKEMRGAINARGLYMLKEDVSLFDNQFFHVSTVEAAAIDPQQRLLLEIAYEAFEDAGIPLDSLAASETGVYCAVANSDYDLIQSRDPELSPNHRFTGTGPALVSNRISYHFDLLGPSITVDTACSGSLVAVHQAVKAIRSGEIKQALVCGTNLVLDAEKMSTMSSMQVLSDDGRCYAFDTRANGFGRGEGVAAIVIKSVDDAIRDGDTIQSIIRSTCVNQDGQTPSVTMPSQEAQVKMINKVYADAGLDPRDTCYVEAHGTGTKTGDKIEAGALLETFCRDRSPESPLYVGSIKTNIGHTEATAGLAGLVKSVMILKNSKIPANLNFIKPNERIAPHDAVFKVPRKLMPWPANKVRRASVNSFGYGGTNAHVVLEAPEDFLASHAQLLVSRKQSAMNGGSSRGTASAGSTSSGTPLDSRSSRSITPPPNGTQKLEDSVSSLSTIPDAAQKLLANGVPTHLTQSEAKLVTEAIQTLTQKSEQASDRRRLFVLSHAVERGMGGLAKNLRQYLQAQPKGDIELLDTLAYTLAMRRTRHAFRIALSATSMDALLESLDAIEKGTIRPHRASKDASLCFAFTGQGAQWARMGQELSSAYPVFAASMSNSELQLASMGAEWSLSNELSKKAADSRINEPAISQPCCTAIQIALVNLLRSWGIKPSVTCGHSSGEIAAAYAAGFLSDYDSMKISYFRGQAVAKLKVLHPTLDGGMMAVGIGAEKAREFISKHKSDDPSVKVVVACINSPQSVTLSGDRSLLKLIQGDLEKEGIFNRFLMVDVAYHSHHMELVAKDYLESMKGLQPLQADDSVHMISSVTGKATESQAMNAEYWVENMVSTVRFSEALTDALAFSKEDSTSPANTILEIGPHAALAGPIKQILKAIGNTSSKVTYHSMLSRNVDAVETALKASGDLFALGHSVGFNAINDPNDAVEKKILQSMPTYNWQHTMSHWAESRTAKQYRLRQFPRHDLLGMAASDTMPAEPTWRNYVSLDDMPWTNGHVINGQAIYPAAGYICMVLEALKQTTIGAGKLWKNIAVQFRQITVGRALLLPESTRVETFFTLRKYQDAASGWKEFQVLSVSASGEDTEHCRGLVRLEQRDPKDQSEAAQEDARRKKDVLTAFADAQKTCRRPANVTKHYSDLKAIGMNYTGPFANITEMKTKPHVALCTITVPETKSAMPGSFEQPHVIHPATLDMCFQTVFPALTASTKMDSSMVIAGIDELEISSNFSCDIGKHLLTHSTIEPFGRQKYKAFISAADVNLKESSLITIRGLRINSTFSLSGSAHQSQGQSLCHQLHWAPDIASAQEAEINRVCSIGMESNPAEERRNTFDRYIQRLIPQVLAAITAEDEAAMTEHHRKLVHWMRSQPQIPDGSDIAKFKEEAQALGAEGRMLAQVGDNLVDILTGKVEPLSVMMRDDLLYELYAMVNMWRCNMKLANYLRQLQFKNPRMRILEIGAGTASTSIKVLQALIGDAKTRQAGKDNIDKYVFTDISSGFFEKSRAKLEDYDGLLDFKKLDIEKPVSEQGFEEGSFDVIIASNVLHATQTMTKTMQNVRSLLKPEGKLCLVEITEQHMLWHMTVGTLSGWWLGEADGRPDSPLLSLPKWDNLLQNTGFSGIDVQMNDYASEHEHQVTLMIASAKPQLELKQQPAIEIICNDQEIALANAFRKSVAAADQQRQIRQSSLQEAEFVNKVCVVLLEAVTPFLGSCNQEQFEKVQLMFGQAKQVLWVTRGGAVEASKPEHAVITGLARTLRSEDHSLTIVTLDLDSKTESAAHEARHVFDVFNMAFGPRASSSFFPEFEYAVRNNQIMIPRVIDDSALETHVRNVVDDLEPALGPLRPGAALELEIQTPGILDSLYWTESKVHSQRPKPNEVRVEAKMIALNFKDLMNAMGQLPGLTAMLIECSGVVVEVGADAQGEFNVGDRVCAIHPEGIATTSNIDYRLVAKIPDDMSMDFAAAIPVSYGTALYSLRDAGRMKKGDSVLIHAAAGALGQAAIAIAQHYQAGEIFVTVGTQEKRDLIKKKFGIPDDHIFSSRTTTFAAGIARMTNGRGVDIVLNSLSGEAMRESQNCLARFGRFVEVGKKDLLSNSRMEIAYLEKNASFSAVDLGMVGQYMPDEFNDLLKTVIRLIHTKELQPVSPITVSPISDLENSFRQMQTGKHTGKLIMEIEQDSQIKIRHAPPAPIRMKGDATYLVVGGLGGIGKALIRHLVGLGAKNIATLSRGGVDSESKSSFVTEMSEAGVNLIVQQGSVTNVEDVKAIKEAVGQYPVRGIVQAAMVLQDTIMSNMTYAQWRAALGPKVTGTLNLHTVFDTELDFFLCLSSVAGTIGSHGQGNYSAGSTFQDAFARSLSSRNYPVRSIDLCIVGSEGYAAEHQVAQKHAARYGAGVVTIDEVFALVDHAISTPAAGNLTSQVLVGVNPADPKSGSDESMAQRTDPRLSHVWNTGSRQSTSNASGGEVDLATALQNSADQETAVQTVLTALTEKLSRLLGIAAEEISPQQSVSSYGMDSLIAVELRNWVLKQLESYVETVELMSPLLILNLATLMAERSRLVPAALFAKKE